MPWSKFKTGPVTCTSSSNQLTVIISWSFFSEIFKKNWTEDKTECIDSDYEKTTVTYKPDESGEWCNGQECSSPGWFWSHPLESFWKVSGSWWQHSGWTPALHRQSASASRRIWPERFLKCSAAQTKLHSQYNSGQEVALRSEYLREDTETCGWVQSALYDATSVGLTW